MERGYETRENDWGDKPVRVLARTSEEKHFLKRMEENPKRNERFCLIKKAIEKMYERGIDKCLGRKNFLRQLDGDVSLFEVKVAGQVIRVMAYLHRWSGGIGMVLLFDFDGHQGSDKIPKPLMEKGRRLAREAKVCIEREKQWQ